ncbi:hypothetical protein ABI59_04465 [Acidobacteria bacterium Mor1]|nr:hypothetical protein ABI59_04465 [Acidobacteria bacterium Mor1]
MAPSAEQVSEPPVGAPSAAEHRAHAMASGLGPLSTRGGVATGAEGFVVEGTVRFPPPILAGEAHALQGTGYSVVLPGENLLLIYDARTGTLAHQEVINGRNYHASGRAVIVDEPGYRRLLYPQERHPDQVYDLSVPDEPRVLAAFDACSRNFVALRGTGAVFAYGRDCGELIDLDSGEPLGELDFRRIASPISLTEDSRSLLLFLAELSYDQWALITLDVTDPSAPLELARQLVEDPGELLPASARDVLLMRKHEQVVLLNRDGEPRGAVPLRPHAVEQLELVETEDQIVLAIAEEEGIELWDITDPAAPSRIAGLDVGGLFERSSGVMESLSPRPLLMVAAGEAREVVLIDVRDGSIVGRVATPGQARPWSVSVDRESGDLVTVINRRMLNIAQIYEPGGEAVIETVSFAVPQEPEHVAGYREVAPVEIERMVTLGSRYVVTYDASHNALNVVDVLRREVVAGSGLVGGPDIPRETDEGDGTAAAGYYDPDLELMAAGGSTIAVAGRYSLEILQFDGRELRHRERFAWSSSDGAGVTDVEVLEDGSVIWFRGYITRYSVLEIWHPDGRRGRLDFHIPNYRYVTGMDVSPAGDRVVVCGDYLFNAAPMVMVDIVDRANPREMWRSDEEHFTYAQFTPDGDAVVATRGAIWWISPQLFDIETGDPLSEPGEQAPIFWHWGSGTTFGSGEGARVSFWHWTFRAWGSVIYDLSKDPPEVIGQSDPYCCDPWQIPRADGEAYYDFVGGGVLLGSAGGDYSIYGIGRWSFPSVLAPGYIAVRDGFGTPDGIAVLRDPAIAPARIRR